MTRFQQLICLILLCPGVLLASGWTAGFGHAPLLKDSDLQSSASICLAGYGLLCSRKAVGIHDEVSIRSLYLADDSLGYLIPSAEFGLKGAYEEQMAVSKSIGDQAAKSLKKLRQQCANSH
ncbi:MAG: hypothetical protein ACR2PT_02005 [Endozoicomonas sp.]